MTNLIPTREITIKISQLNVDHSKSAKFLKSNVNLYTIENYSYGLQWNMPTTDNELYTQSHFVTPKTCVV